MTTPSGTADSGLPSPVNRAVFNTSSMRQLAEAMTEPPDPGSVNRRWGIIAAYNGPPNYTVDVTIGGVLVPDLAYDAAYTPTVGEVVMLDVVGTDTVVIGTTSPGQWRTGEIEPSFLSVPKSGTLICQGQAISRTTYANLWSWVQANGLNGNPTVVSSTFEDGSTWTAGANWTQTNSTARAHSGTHSLLLTRANATVGNGYVLVNRSVVSGYSYTWSLWVFASAATAYSLSVQGLNGSGAAIDPPRLASLVFTPTAAAWQQVSVTFTVPPGIASVNLYLTDDPNQSPTSGSTINLDDSSLSTNLGKPFGNGDGSTTFTIPDLRGRVAIGAGALGTDQYNLGDLPGAARTSLTTAHMPSHNHAVSATTAVTVNTSSSAGNHSHAGLTGGESANHTHSIPSGIMLNPVAHSHAGGAPGILSEAPNPYDGGGALASTNGQSGGHVHVIGADGTHTHTSTGSATTTVSQSTVGGSITPVDVRQPAFVVNWLIYV